MTPAPTPALSNALVCAAYKLSNEYGALADLVCPETKKEGRVFPHDVLATWTGEAPEACWAAVEAADRQGLIEYNPSLRAGLLTEKGEDTLEQSGLKPVALCLPNIRQQGEEFKDVVVNAARAMSPEAQQRLAEALAADEDGQGAAAPRSKGVSP